MQKLGVDTDLAKQSLSRRFGGHVNDLLTAWDSFKNVGRRTPDRATIFRWLSGSLPRHREDFLSLCGLLDVDPMAILSLPPGEEAAALQHISRSFWLNRWTQPALGFLSEFYGHHSDWPPAPLAKRYFCRPWHIEEFAHPATGNVNYYAALNLSASPFVRGQAFHFAYSEPAVALKRWIQYGFVERRERRVRLLSISGRTGQYEAATEGEPCLVETWFGPSPCLFRVASLHPFALEVLDRSPGTDRKVGFWF